MVLYCPYDFDDFKPHKMGISEPLLRDCLPNTQAR